LLRDPTDELTSHCFKKEGSILYYGSKTSPNSSPISKRQILLPVISNHLIFDDPITRSPKPQDHVKSSILQFQHKNLSSTNSVSPKEVKKEKIDERVSFVHGIPRKNTSGFKFFETIGGKIWDSVLFVCSLFKN
jgi:hypothetical protein